MLCLRGTAVGKGQTQMSIWWILLYACVGQVGPPPGSAPCVLLSNPNLCA